ncbi:hypothetical protein NX059_012427 [Plenodomus lindquistii]|nr:hypothetical protein NX059_012427 [Plenodomus lindquistii]
MAMPFLSLPARYVPAQELLQPHPLSPAPSPKALRNGDGPPFHVLLGDSLLAFEGGEAFPESAGNVWGWVRVGTIKFPDHDPDLPRIVYENGAQVAQIVYAQFEENDDLEIGLDSEDIPMIRFFTHGVDKDGVTLPQNALMASSDQTRLAVRVTILDINFIDADSWYDGWDTARDLWRWTYWKLMNTYINAGGPGWRRGGNDDDAHAMLTLDCPREEVGDDDGANMVLFHSLTHNTDT